jgi:proline iminopeptidase
MRLTAGCGWSVLGRPALPLVVGLLAAACTNPAPMSAPPRPRPQEEFIGVEGGRIWYHVVGDGPGIPLLLVHGGPGGRSCYMAALKWLGSERRVIFYDQLGTGRSDRPTDTTLWQLPRFVAEIDAIRQVLQLREVYLYGHSWGGAVVAEYLLTRPHSGVRAAILASPLLSTRRWLADARLLRAQLPSELQRVLSAHEAAGTFDAPEYLAATDSFYARFLTRRTPPVRHPECEGVRENAQIYRQMWGPTEFYVTGNLRGYDRTSRLHELRLPVLLLAGEYDEARPETIREFAGLIPGARFQLVEGAAHSITLDQPEQVVSLVRDFLRTVEQR